MNDGGSLALEINNGKEENLVRSRIVGEEVLVEHQLLKDFSSAAGVNEPSERKLPQDADEWKGNVC